LLDGLHRLESDDLDQLRLRRETNAMH
jgi:hypothetical protein